MSQVTTTKMTSRGQVVIPQEVREKLGLTPGARFVVVGDGDVVILRLLSPPDPSEFDDLLAQARAQARRAGLKKSDVARAISRVRRKR